MFPFHRRSANRIYDWLERLNSVHYIGAGFKMVEGDGFEPSYAEAGRFTVLTKNPYPIDIIVHSMSGFQSVEFCVEK
jgi:hypothetical protein